MTMGAGTICFACQRLLPPGGKPKCGAFPDGIPSAIYYGAFDHRQPFGGEQTDGAGNPLLFVLEDDKALAAYERLKATLTTN